MKKLIIVLLILNLFLPFVYSINANITKTDFYKENTQAFRLYEGDGISFLKDDKEYVISVDEIGRGNIRLKSFGYKEDDTRETFYLPITETYSNKIDFERDNIYDMKVDLVKIGNNGTTVDLFFEALNEPRTTNENKPNNTLLTGLIITLSIIIVGLIIYFIFKKK